jgi:flagellar basal-body rod protein FlgB
VRDISRHPPLSKECACRGAKGQRVKKVTPGRRVAVGLTVHPQGGRGKPCFCNAAGRGTVLAQARGGEWRGAWMRIAEVDRITALLTDFLDVQSRRAEVVASNLANGDTPGFQAKELDFREHLRTAAQAALLPPTATAQSEAPLASTLRTVEQTGNVPGLDGNTVDGDAGRCRVAIPDRHATVADAFPRPARSDPGRQVAGLRIADCRLRTLRLSDS